MFKQVLYCSGQRSVKLVNKLRTLLPTVLQYVVCQIRHGKLLRHGHFDELLLPYGNDFACIFPIKAAPSRYGFDTLLSGVQIMQLVYQRLIINTAHGTVHFCLSSHDHDRAAVPISL